MGNQLIRTNNLTTTRNLKACKVRYVNNRTPRIEDRSVLLLPGTYELRYDVFCIRQPREREPRAYYVVERVVGTLDTHTGRIHEAILKRLERLMRQVTIMQNNGDARPRIVIEKSIVDTIRNQGPAT